MKISRLLWLIIVFLISSFPFSGNLAAQDNAVEEPRGYSPAVHNLSTNLVAPAIAITTLQGRGETTAWDFESTASVYMARNDSRFIEIAVSLGADPDVSLSGFERDAYIEAVYLFVRNGVDFTPLFGLHHGAMGAGFYRSGTAFDQASLMSELLYAGGIDNSLEVGDVTLSEIELLSLLSVSSPRTACEMLANGGVPAVFDGVSDCGSIGSSAGSVTSVVMSHAWVKTQFQGQDNIFDPALKVYEWSEGNANFRNLLIPTQAEVQEAVGGNWSVGYEDDVEFGEYSGPDPIGLQSYLNERVGTLNSALNSGAYPLSTHELIGGRRLKLIESSVAGQDSEYQAWTGLSNIQQFPTELKVVASIDVSLPGVVPTNHGSGSTDTLSVDIYLERIGIDPFVISPINLTAPDSSHNFSGASTGQDAFSTFELSILRPGSEDHTMMGDTGYEGGGGDSSLRRNDVSGDNVFLIEYVQRDIYFGYWNVELDINVPYAGEDGEYGDFFVRKRPSLYTASNLIISSSTGSSQAQRIYERFLPKKTNVFYGLFVDDGLSLAQCEETRSRAGPPTGGSFSGCAGSASRLDRPEPPNTSPGTTFSSCDHTMWDLSNVADEFIEPGGGADALGGINIDTDQSACTANLSMQFPTILSHDKAIRTKSLIANDWSENATKTVDIFGRVSNSRAQHMMSVGLVTSDIKTDFDLSIISDALEIDVDTQFSFSGLTDRKRRASSLSVAASLSALEGILLQKLTGAPRVDSAATKADWYAWNGNYDQNTGLHFGPYASELKSNAPENRLSSTNGLATFVSSFEPSDTNGYSKMYALPRKSPGPSEDTQWDYADEDKFRGRSALQLGFFEREDGDHLQISYIIGSGTKGGSGAKVPEFKSPEFDEEALSQAGYDALHGDFSVDSQLGYVSFSPKPFMSVGHELSALDLTAVYKGASSGPGPFGQGWSHNHDGKVILSTNLDAAFSGTYAHPVLPILVAASSSMALADHETFGFEQSQVLPQSLMIHGWFARKVYENEAQIVFPKGSATFYKLPGVGFVNPGSPTSSLTQTGERRIYEGIRPYFSEQEKADLRRIPNHQRDFVQGFKKIDHVIAQQYFDYSQMNFEFISPDKTTYKFERMPTLLTDQANAACWPDEEKPFDSSYSENSHEFCGAGAGSFQIKTVEYTDGRKLNYTYTQTQTNSFFEAISGVQNFQFGTVLERVDLISTDDGGEAILNSLGFEYGAQAGIRFRLRNLNIGLDNPTDSSVRNSRRLLIPDPALSFGQSQYVTKVFWINDGKCAGDDVSRQNPDCSIVDFNYFKRPLSSSSGYGDLASPLLMSVADRVGFTHSFEYEVVNSEQADSYNQDYLLKSFTPASLDAPIFSIEHSPLGRVTSLTDAEGREVKYGVNGVVNTVTDAAGAETTNLYDSQGRLVSTIAPEYTVSEPQ